MGYVLKQLVLGALVLAVLSGCANNPLMQTSNATSTETAQSIEDNLDEALEDAPSESRRQAPEDVTEALMPESCRRRPSSRAWLRVRITMPWCIQRFPGP